MIGTWLTIFTYWFTFRDSFIDESGETDLNAWAGYRDANKQRFVSRYKLAQRL